ncbi:MAG: endonuclease/exonuclease/phosphatase family metal-dependent hydrolase [Neolewinella sp.]
MFKKLIFFLGNVLAAITGAGLLARFIPPDVWWPPAVIALLLPGLLLLTLLFALWALYKKSWKAAAFPLLVLAGGFPLIGRLFVVTISSPPATPAKNITVLTANVRGYKNGAWQGIKPALRTAFMSSIKPDIMLLQETSGYVNDIKAASKLSKRHQPNKKSIATYADNPTFIADKFASPGNYNGFLITDVETEIGTIRIINAHLQSNRISGMAGQIGRDKDIGQEIDRAESMFRNYGAAAAIRASQAEDIRKAIKESPHPVIVGGDFNDVPSSYTYQRILTDRLKDAWAEYGNGVGTTFTGPLPFLRIDFLLVDKSLTIHDIERVETGFSDHRGLRLVLSR